MLDKQINLFKVDTNAFLSEEEKNAKTNLIKLQFQKKELIKNGESREEIEQIEEKIKEEKKAYKIKLLDISKKAVEYNNSNIIKKIRQLDERYLSYIDSKTGDSKINISNVVSMFESTLSRSFGIKTNELTYDIFIVEIFYYDIAQDLIINGFNYNGKHYVYFSSSAGQIRTKKAVFVEEEKYKKCQLKLMCGLTIDKINSMGGMNINKFLAYLALSNSATETWETVFNKHFDIDKSIVVDDFETLVKGKVDNIDYNTYEITPNVIQEMPIPHTDGCGMIISSYCKKNFMIRLPFIKGLLGSFDFVKFIKENNCSPIVKDIWGKEYNIIKEDIQVIFTKSQLKMYKYYKNWDEYKKYFKQYECEACVCNMEEDKIYNAKINYQMLQTLHDINDKEIISLCKYSNKNILEISNSVDNMLKFFGVYVDDDNDDKKDYFQKALKIYPELLNDVSNKSDLKDLRNSLIKKYRGGKLDIAGKFTFVLPDLYAFCEWLFMGIKSPKGLIENNEVFCRLYKNSDELDCLRSPHLYVEHAIRKNVYNKKYRNQKLNNWFCTDAIYTSTKDLISRILQFDVDGDRLLVISQKNIIEIAKRNMNNINPLYYEMKKAKAELITPENEYNGLKLAFTGGNIGMISNDITKIWNMDKIGEEELNAIRWLCMETNFTIDYAKTLFKPKRPNNVDAILKKYHNIKVPYFFYYAKDKNKNQVNLINKSTLNRISTEIKSNKMMFLPIKELSSINYKLFLKDKDINYSNQEINNIYIKWNKKYGNNINIDEEDTNKNNIFIICSQIKEEFYRIEKDEEKILNSLVTFLYGKKSSRKKKLLWYLYGEQMYNNLLNNLDNNTGVCMKCGKRINKKDLIRNKCRKCREEEIVKNHGKKIIKCKDCGKEFEVKSNSNKKTRCAECQAIFDKEKKRLWKERQKVD